MRGDSFICKKLEISKSFSIIEYYELLSVILDALYIVMKGGNALSLIDEKHDEMTCYHKKWQMGLRVSRNNTFYYLCPLTIFAAASYGRPLEDGCRQVYKTASPYHLSLLIVVLQTSAAIALPPSGSWNLP